MQPHTDNLWPLKQYPRSCRCSCSNIFGYSDSPPWPGTGSASTRTGRPQDGYRLAHWAPSAFELPTSTITILYSLPEVIIRVNIVCGPPARSVSHQLPRCLAGFTLLAPNLSGGCQKRANYPYYFQYVTNCMFANCFVLINMQMPRGMAPFAVKLNGCVQFEGGFHG